MIYIFLIIFVFFVLITYFKMADTLGIIDNPNQSSSHANHFTHQIAEIEL